jgi:2-oxoglutarate ferredoxin oxidoreductase subunit delta
MIEYFRLNIQFSIFNSEFPAFGGSGLGPREEWSMAKPKLKQHHINRDWCKGCGICVELCPKKVLELDDEDKVRAVRPLDCICCRLCELRCPDLAIEIETEE